MLTLVVNGKSLPVDLAPETPLLWALRDTLGLTGTKFGCGIGACGVGNALFALTGERQRSLPFKVSAGARPSGTPSR
jgi:isoquinoline 1-oxidoreductase subunit alpha